MQTSHIVFINDRPLVFSYVYSKQLPVEYTGYAILNDESSTIDKAIKLLESGKEIGVVYFSESPDESWKRFISKYILIEAAGGLVKNKEGKFLFIFRNGKWDLPKGKAEYDETPEMTALREVEEECGLKNLKIEKVLTKTFHTYKEKGKLILKKTHWYLMTIDEDQKLIPQTEEGITEVKWVAENRIEREVLVNTYASIKGIFS
ncbi:MAG: NUDIX domain-containing protein [Bacteroidia bacterium]|nr:NUDIX domain-containing protein [Bacteroidia bacterium]MBP6657116.1 NUDIX domain-containing protein [Bacteroidia bacterium]